MSLVTRPRLTQQERTERTRELLLDATVDCLVELGYARTSTNEICRRAGVSRGAQQHHFATKADLMAHAIEHLVSKLVASMSEYPSVSLPGPDRVAMGIDLLWQGYSGSLSTAVMELWVAARTDPELRAAMHPIDKALARRTGELFHEVLGDHAPPDQPDVPLWLTVNLIRGLALDAMLGGDPTRRDQLLQEWKTIAVKTYGT
ncbi:TetR/AcrR family transcriptional regulator [Kutzneria sp. NPDC052558]|uniref:TetR/AcrR family transcriptional regulator n=1 Tax=Kutzneria sp. NPDC052558 TaxID=3364121 RepID=UPI0037CB4F35